MSAPLSKYFTGIGAKRLSKVEIKPNDSNQHEFNGIKKLIKIFGTDKVKFSGKFIYLTDEEDSVLEEECSLTWYDARKKDPIRTEHRLYYAHNDIIEKAAIGDLVVIGRLAQHQLAIIIAKAGSTSEKQLLWLFGLSEVENKVIVKDLSEDKKGLGFAGNYIVSSLGFEIEETIPDYLQLILERFGENFPTTALFSEFARTTIKNISPIEAPDDALLSLIQQEELLFRTLERHLVQKKLKSGFGKDGLDVDEFINFSLSIQNRRKSRAGFAFENHLAFIFKMNKVSFTKKGKTENNYEPDFLFPGINYYWNQDFKANLLTMLGLKTTAKERWRQILSEANKIWPKHLITLEPAISKNQTDQMKAEKVQLIIPKGLMDTYSKEQRNDLITLSDFIKYVLNKQDKHLKT